MWLVMCARVCVCVLLCSGWMMKYLSVFMWMHCKLCSFVSWAIVSAWLQMLLPHPSLQLFKQLKAFRDQSEAGQKEPLQPQIHQVLTCEELCELSLSYRSHLSYATSVITVEFIFLSLYINGKQAATVPTVWVIPFQVLKCPFSFYAFNLEQKPQDYKHDVKFFLS